MFGLPQGFSQPPNPNGSAQPMNAPFQMGMMSGMAMQMNAHHQRGMDLYKQNPEAFMANQRRYEQEKVEKAAREKAEAERAAMAHPFVPPQAYGHPQIYGQSPAPYGQPQAYGPPIPQGQPQLQGRPSQAPTSPQPHTPHLHHLHRHCNHSKTPPKFSPSCVRCKDSAACFACMGTGVLAEKQCSTCCGSGGCSSCFRMPFCCPPAVGEIRNHRRVTYLRDILRDTECSKCKTSGICFGCLGTGSGVHGGGSICSACCGTGGCDSCYRMPNGHYNIKHVECTRCKKSGTCNSCSGSGTRSGSKCSTCRGSGGCDSCYRMPKDRQPKPARHPKYGCSNPYSSRNSCNQCKDGHNCNSCIGTGKRSGNSCSACNGTGRCSSCKKGPHR
ncbi:hypothetical protein PROFUN_02811 [Planoprotostelium fungivorum]|uniref:Uncharacterized protein n=1 Tax=Planoprotostelium fungivorum TaxID=1890364 RepID=A0A2P6NXN5_9EUKA|nr:hypothetical protein PROFUN_02811 [Planoprotostelium fungivorum]